MQLYKINLQKNL